MKTCNSLSALRKHLKGQHSRTNNQQTSNVDHSSLMRCNKCMNKKFTTKRALQLHQTRLPINRTGLIVSVEDKASHEILERIENRQADDQREKSSGPDMFGQCLIVSFLWTLFYTTACRLNVFCRAWKATDFLLALLSDLCQPRLRVMTNKDHSFRCSTIPHTPLWWTSIPPRQPPCSLTCLCWGVAHESNKKFQPVRSPSFIFSTASCCSHFDMICMNRCC